MGLLEIIDDKKDLRFEAVNPVVGTLHSLRTFCHSLGTLQRRFCLAPCALPPNQRAVGCYHSAWTERRTISSSSLSAIGTIGRFCSSPNSSLSAEKNQCSDLEIPYTNPGTQQREWWKCYYVPLAPNRVGYLSRDITHQKALEAIMRKQGEELEKAVQERTRDLEEALQVKNRFLAVVSHEIRTPIAVRF